MEEWNISKQYTQEFKNDAVRYWGSIQSWELPDVQRTWESVKQLSQIGGNFLETARREEQIQEQGKRRLNVFGVLRRVGVSRSGYLSWKKRLPSNREK